MRPQEPHQLGDESDLFCAIQEGVNYSLLAQNTRVGIFEVTTQGDTYNEVYHDDEALDQKLKEIQSEADIALKGRDIRLRNFFIYRDNDFKLEISPDSLLNVCTVLDVPAPFLQGVLQHQFWARPGDGLYSFNDENGKISRIDIFYRCAAWKKISHNSHIFTTYNVAKKRTTNICVDPVTDSLSIFERLASQITKSTVDQPLAIHVIFTSKALEYQTAEGTRLRDKTVNDEKGKYAANPKTKTEALHKLSQLLHLLVEDLSDCEARMLFLQEASRELNKAIDTTPMVGDMANCADQFAQLLSRSRDSKRWISSYRDRIGVRINLAFNVSAQVDNEVSLDIARSTTTIAQAAQQDSSSMITVAAVTMFFLPGTFVSAIFSMSFFNFQQDDDGTQQL